MILLPDTIVRFLPHSIQTAYLRGLDRRIVRLHLEHSSLETVLEGCDPGWEYTEGFRAHLSRRLDDLDKEASLIAAQIVRFDPDSAEQPPHA